MSGGGGNGSSGAFCFVGAGRFLTHFDAGLLAALPCAALSLAHVADQALNMAAFRRQNKADNAKNEAKRALEAPHATALLLSLRGADAAIVNQWASAPSVNRDRTDRLWTALSKGAPCAAALHAMRSSANASAGDASASASGSEQPPRNFEVFNAVCYGLPSVAIADK
jgi:hypothetical protein